MGETSSYLRENQDWHTGFLVDKAKGGSDAAWRALFERYHRMLTGQMQARFYGVLKRRCDAEDVLQTAFIKAYENLDGFEYKGEGSFRRWLATLVMRVFADELRNHKVEQQKTVEPGSAVKDIADEAQIERAAAELKNEQMLAAMNKLADEDRDLLLQRHFEELSFEQIAAHQEVPRETARQMYMQAMARLKRMLREE